MHKVFVATTVHGRYDVRIFLKQCRSIASHGNDVTLVVQDGKGNESREGVKILDLGTPPADRIRRIIFSPWRMYRFLQAVPADIIHFHDPELLPVGFLLRSNKRHLIYDSHEDFPRQVLSKHWIHPVLRKSVSILFELFENFIAKRLDAVVCATPFIAKRFKRINPNSIDINNFPMLEEFQTPDRQQKQPFSRTICYIGAMTRERGITELLEALEILQDVTLIACGPFESQAYADELMAMPGWKFVDYRGVVGRVEVVDILECSSIGMVTLLPTPNQIDSLPIKMFEYMAAGLTIIASDFPLWRRIVEENNCGRCVDPSSPGDIAEAIANLLSNEALCRDMGNTGKEAIANRYNWINEAEKLLEIYRKVLK
ncbi:MAG TPA: glycosyltransferase family 4 protein [Dongiaceae bacterium]|nr:glycosyltransferase family 4 protein [Dongiaceae bacterium]